MANFRVTFVGDVMVQAATAEDAIKEALGRPSAEPETYLSIDVEEIRTCRFCECTDDAACEDGCDWVDDAQDVCDNPACLAKLAAEVSHA